MKKLSLLLSLVFIVLIACQESGTNTQTDKEKILSDSLKIAASIAPSTISYAQLKSADSNKALAASAYAQSTFSGYSPSKVNDGSTNVSVGGTYSWANGHRYKPDGYLPQWFDLRFDSTITFSKINVFTTDNYELKQFKVLVNSAAGWDTISSVYNNTNTLVSLSYDTISANTIRILCEKGPDNQYVYARLNEIQVY